MAASPGRRSSSSSSVPWLLFSLPCSSPSTSSEHVAVVQRRFPLSSRLPAIASQRLIGALPLQCPRRPTRCCSSLSPLCRARRHSIHPTLASLHPHTPLAHAHHARSLPPLSTLLLFRVAQAVIHCAAFHMHLTIRSRSSCPPPSHPIYTADRQAYAGKQTTRIASALWTNGSPLPVCFSIASNYIFNQHNSSCHPAFISPDIFCDVSFVLLIPTKLPASASSKPPLPHHSFTAA